MLRLAAPAKINLHLEILGRRDDGFHALETIFQTIDLHDIVGVACASGTGIALDCSDRSLPGDAGNLAWRAAAAVQARRPRLGRVLITLDKRVLDRPMAAVTVVDGSKMQTDAYRLRKRRPVMISGVVLHSIPSGYIFDLRTRALASNEGGARIQREASE